ncbi:hypothetical protein DFH09DRAFT_1453536 [Mycena vulgaris]|nr:hypothetical protein DFH09DRAFT_1453536 [Mycena vulgaris]
MYGYAEPPPPTPCTSATLKISRVLQISSIRGRGHEEPRRGTHTDTLQAPESVRARPPALSESPTDLVNGTGLGQSGRDHVRMLHAFSGTRSRDRLQISSIPLQRGRREEQSTNGEHERMLQALNSFGCGRRLGPAHRSRQYGQGEREREHALRRGLKNLESCAPSRRPEDVVEGEGDGDVPGSGPRHILHTSESMEAPRRAGFVATRERGTWSSVRLCIHKRDRQYQYRAREKGKGTYGPSYASRLSSRTLVLNFDGSCSVGTYPLVLEGWGPGAWTI